MYKNNLVSIFLRFSRFRRFPKGKLTQDVSKCEKILEMKKIDFSRSLSISKSIKMMKNGA